MTEGVQFDEQNLILDAIDAAEEIANPLDGLVDKSAIDPGAAFTPVVLEQLAMQLMCNSRLAGKY